MEPHNVRSMLDITVSEWEAGGVMSFLQRIREFTIEALYPRTCAGCGLRGTWVCALCEPQAIAMARLPCCRRCGTLRIRNACACRELHPNILRARSCFPYSAWVADAIKRMKYEDESSRADHLGGYLAETIAMLGRTDVLIPVPLHPRKLQERGYNQSQLLAERAGKELGIPVVPMVKRHRATSSQVGLRGAERLANVANAFSVDDRFVPRVDGHYVLVDDVRTTGSTLNACVSALAGAGITRIGIATVALDMRPADLQYVNSLVASSHVVT